MVVENLISVILPVYNVEEYLVECLDSLLNQEFKNFELIAINDGSTDNCLSILNEYKNKFNSCKIITQENKGLSEARNEGLKHVQGKYIYFLDSDDYILPNTFHNLYKLAEENNLDLVKFDAQPFSEIQGNFKMSNYDTVRVLSENVVYSKVGFVKLARQKFMPSVCVYFIKSSIILKNRLTFKKAILHEDELFTAQLLNNCNRIMYDSNKYFQRRYRANSIMTNSINNNRKSYDSKIEIIKIFNDMQKAEKAKSDFYYFLQSRKNSLYTTLFFYRNIHNQEHIKLFRKLNSRIHMKTFLRETKKVLKF